MRNSLQTVNHLINREVGHRKVSDTSFPLVSRESKSREAQVIQWALDPCLWVGVSQGIPIPEGKGAQGANSVRYFESNLAASGNQHGLKPDFCFTAEISEQTSLRLSGLVYVVQALRAIGLAIVSCLNESDPSSGLAFGLVRWRRELLQRAFLDGTHSSVMTNLKLALNWLHYRKMSSRENTQPDPLPEDWWGVDRGTLINPPFPKYLQCVLPIKGICRIWTSWDVPLTIQEDLIFCRLLAAGRGFPPGDEDICEKSLEKQRVQLHQEAEGPWRENVREVQKYARILATKHSLNFHTSKTHVSTSTSASWEQSVKDGGKNAELALSWDRSLEIQYDLSAFAGKTLVDATNQKIYIPMERASALNLPELYLWDTNDRRAGIVTLETSIKCKLGGPLILSLAVQSLILRGHITVSGTVIADCPLWEEGSKVLSQDRMVLGVNPIPARVVTLPEEGWKGRTLSIPPWSYALMSACARHWFQDNLLAAEPRVGIGFESAYKLWDSVKNLGGVPTGWHKYPHVSGDVSQCTDSTALELHLVLLRTYLEQLERRGCFVPTCVWSSVYLLCSSHIFTYPDRKDGEERVGVGDHVTGVMMGEGLSFIAMLLQNLTLDEKVTDVEIEMATPGTLPPIASRREGLTDIVGDDYLRKFCSQPLLYSKLAWEWYSWRMSKGKNGVSQTCLQLAEEWGYAKPPSFFTDKESKAPYGRHISKQDVIKIKYFAIPGPNASKDSPAWVGRCRPLSQHLDWCPDIRKESKAILCDAFRRSYSDIPHSIPLSWTLPGNLGGLNYPTVRTAKSILRKMKVERRVQALFSLPQWELQATLLRLSSFHQPHGTGKGVAIPRFRDLDIMLGGFARTPSIEMTHQPILAETVSRYLMSNPSSLAPKTGWKWSAVIRALAPSQEQVTVYLRSLDYVPIASIDAHALRTETLRALVNGDTLTRSSLIPRSGRSAAEILPRILAGVSRRYPLSEDDWEWVKERWATAASKTTSPTDLGIVLAYLQGPGFVKKDSAYAENFDETYPWSFSLRKEMEPWEY